jgi:hypothetical protein
LKLNLDDSHLVVRECHAIILADFLVGGLARFLSSRHDEDCCAPCMDVVLSLEA